MKKPPQTAYRRIQISSNYSETLLYVPNALDYNAIRPLITLKFQFPLTFDGFFIFFVLVNATSGYNALIRLEKIQNDEK